MPFEALSIERLANRCETFFDAELASIGSFSEILSSDMPPVDAVDGEPGLLISLASLFLAGETLSPKHDHLVIILVRADSARYQRRDFARSTCRSGPGGTRRRHCP
jgi:hypothetical protein